MKTSLSFAAALVILFAFPSCSGGDFAITTPTWSFESSQPPEVEPQK